MGYLKSGLPKALAVLTCCGIVAGGSASLMAFDKSVIQTCDKSIINNSDKYKSDNSETVDEMGDITFTDTTVAETYFNVATEKKAVTTKATTIKKTTTTKKTSHETTTVAKTTTETTTAETSAKKKKTTTTTAPEDDGLNIEDVSTQTAKAEKTTTLETVAADETEKETTTEETKPETTTTKAETTTVKTTTAAPKTTTTAKKTTTKATTTAPVTTTKKVTTTKAPSVDNGSTPASRLNAAKLKPNKFLSGREDKILTKYLNKIIDDDMTIYEKVVACYDYLIENTYYAYGGWGNAIESVLVDGYGTCTEYSYVLCAMMKYIGFDAKTVDGKTAMAAGGYGYHMWVEVDINGTTYVMDAQVDDNMSWGGNISHARFVKTYSEVSGQYKK